MSTTWINLENIMVCERSQSQKTTVVTKDILWFFNFHVISFIWNFQNRKLCGDQKEISDRLRLTVLGGNGDGLLMDMGLFLGD